jgi:hypothetical protein
MGRGPEAAPAVREDQGEVHVTGAGHRQCDTSGAPSQAGAWRKPLCCSDFSAPAGRTLGAIVIGTFRIPWNARFGGTAVLSFVPSLAAFRCMRNGPSSGTTLRHALEGIRRRRGASGRADATLPFSKGCARVRDCGSCEASLARGMPLVGAGWRVPQLARAPRSHPDLKRPAQLISWAHTTRSNGDRIR